MTSVGEVMAIGRNFEEAIQKAVRMVSGGRIDGIDGATVNGPKFQPDAAQLEELLRVPTDRRLGAIQLALERGYTINQINQLSKIDKWFLSKLKNIAGFKEEASRCT